jgi:hypothetical protein
MTPRSLFLAAALAGALSPVFANSTATFDPTTEIAYFHGEAPLFVGGTDTVTFTGLAAGSYDYTLSISAQYIDNLTADLNGTPVALNSTGHFTFGGTDGSGSVPFTLVLTGDPEIGAAYSGQLGITGNSGPSNAPEPTSAVLMLAGLGVAALKLRQRKAN